jgi:hypothetical protein
MEEQHPFSAATCCVCGIRFGLPTVRFQYLKDHGGTFYCPNGHSLFFHDSTVAKLNRKINALQTELAQTRTWLSDQRKTLKDYQAKFKAESEVKRRRINAGVCPHCQRSFRALARHIRTKHPQEPLPNKQ